MNDSDRKTQGMFDDDMFRGFFGDGLNHFIEAHNNCHIHLKVAYDELKNGCSKVVFYSRKKLCQSCAGTGDANKEPPSQCPACSGSGTNTKTKTGFLGWTKTTTEACSYCFGVGSIAKTPCFTCKGYRIIEVSERQVISIPASPMTHVAHTFTYPGLGNYINDDTNGDLTVKVVT